MSKHSAAATRRPTNGPESGTRRRRRTTTKGADEPIALRPSALASEPVEALPKPADIFEDWIHEIRIALGLPKSATHAETIQRIRARGEALSAYTTTILEHGSTRREFVEGSEAEMVESLGAACYCDDDAGRVARLFALGTSDVRAGALQTLSAIGEVMGIVTRHVPIGVDDGPLQERWDHLHYFVSELADVAVWYGDRLDAGRRAAKKSEGDQRDGIAAEVASIADALTEAGCGRIVTVEPEQKRLVALAKRLKRTV